MSKNPNFSKTSSRIYKIRCCGDSNAVATMLEDLADKVRNGTIHCNDELFYEMNSMAYVAEANRADWHKKERKNIE